MDEDVWVDDLVGSRDKEEEHEIDVEENVFEANNEINIEEV